MKIEIINVDLTHEDLGIIKKQQIVYFDENNIEVTRENYSPSHPLYEVDFNNPIIKLFIRQKIGV